MSLGKIKHLIVDTSAFIKGAALQDIADEVLTVQEVIDEVTSKRQLRRLVVLPYNLRVKDVFVENIKFITDFSKKTGDYTSLSATDIKVMALTYQMEKEIIGVDHLKIEPNTQRTINVTGLGNRAQVNSEEKEKSIEVEKVPEKKMYEPFETNNIHQNTDLSCNEVLQNNLSEKFNSVDIKCDGDINSVQHLEEDTSSCILVRAEEDNNYESEESESDASSGSDNGEWITPNNVQEKKKEMDHGEHFEDKSAEVACITTDFAMQNVLKQIGLNVTAIDGRLIRHVRTFIFRCTTCFKTCSVMTKVFCPKCGHSTLKKVAVSIDEHGNQQIHINGRKPLTARGKRFSLPTPKGGQHFQYPILTEDQHIHQRRSTRLAQMKNNPLDPDYIAGYSPFTMRDVNSKSAVLGVRNDKHNMKQWLKKSANDVRKKRK